MSAGTVLFFVGVRSEVETLPAIRDQLGGSRTIVVPWCDGDHLELFRLDSLDDLETGAFGILEPKMELRHDLERRVGHESLDLLLVPGVAFDRAGGRLGYGAGYYDRLLARIPTAIPLIAPAFACQLVDKVPQESHDRPVHIIVTEGEVIRCFAVRSQRGRSH